MKEHVVCVIYIKCVKVLDISVKVQCMDDECEDLYECLFRFTRNKLYVFVLYMNYTSELGL